MNPTQEERFAGSIVGQALGDALGFVVEGQSAALCRAYVEDRVRPGRVAAIRRGRYPFGQYSDDTQLARELMQSYREAGGFDPEGYARRVAAIFSEGRIVGYGGATKQAADRLAAGVPWDEAGTPPPAAGNGSAMRAGPVGLLHADDPAMLARVAETQGRITHRDPRSSAGAVAIAGAVNIAARGEPVDHLDFLAELADLTSGVERAFREHLERLSGWVSLEPREAAGHISRVGIEKEAAEGWDEITPFVIPSVLWSLYSFLRTPDSFLQTVSTAIAVGGDVDTTAAMAGAISGARVGLAGLPEKLARRVNDNGSWHAEDLAQLARECSALG